MSVVKRFIRVMTVIGVALSSMLWAAAGWMWWRSSSIADEVTSSRTTVEQIAKGYSQISLRKLTLASAGGRIVVRWDRYWMPVADSTVIELQRATSGFGRKIGTWNIGNGRIGPASCLGWCTARGWVFLGTGGNSFGRRIR